MQQALAVITPHEETLNIKSEMSNQKQDESGTVPTAVKVQTSKALELEASLSIPQHQGFAPKHEELELAETEESISATQIKTNTESTSIHECAQKIPNQQGIDHLESTEESLQDKVEEVSLKPKQMGEPAISIKSPKSTGFVPELLSTNQVSSSDEKPQRPNISSENQNVRLKNFPEQISKPLGEHSKIEHSRALGSNLTKVTAVTEQHGHGHLDIPTCIEKCEGYEPVEESASVNEEFPSENVQFASKSSLKNSAKELAKCIEKVTGHYDGSSQTSEIAETLSGSHIIVADNKCESPPSEAYKVGSSEGFLPINEVTGNLLDNDDSLKSATSLMEGPLGKVKKIESIQGYANKSENISDIPLKGGNTTPPKFANEESSDNFGDQVVNRISNVVGHGEGHGTTFNISTKSNLTTVTEKNVSPPAEAHYMDNSEGFLPIQENIEVITGAESVVQKAVPLTSNIPDRAIQTANIQGHTQTSYEAQESDKTDELTTALSESAKLASSKSLAHQFATCVDKTTGHGEGHGLIEKLSTETDIQKASEKCVTPPGEAAKIGKHEGFVPIEEKVDIMTLSETLSAKANPQTPDIPNRAIKKESQEGYFGVSDNLGEISSTILPSTASESVLSPTKDISQVLQAGFLPVQEKVGDHTESQPLEYKDAQIVEEKPIGLMVAASQSLTGGIATIQEKVEEQANAHLHSTPATTSITDANIVVGQDLLLGSHAQKEQQTEEYSTADSGKAEQIIPTNIANESAICASQEEVTK